MAATRFQAIVFRGDIRDLATDIAYEIDAQDAADLIVELQRFIDSLPDKFQDAFKRMNQLK